MRGVSGMTVVVLDSGRNTSLIPDLHARGADVHLQAFVRDVDFNLSDCRLDDTLTGWRYVPELRKVLLTLTHVSALWTGCASSPERPFLVLEDDAFLTYEPFWPVDVWERLERKLPSTWGAVNLGCNNVDYVSLPRDLKLIPWGPYHWGTYAVLYNPWNACRVSREQILLCSPADYAMYRSVSSFTVWPPMVGHNYSLGSLVGNSKDSTHRRGDWHENNVRLFWQSMRHHRVEL